MPPLNATATDPLTELRAFIYGATSGGLLNVLDLTKTAISLLRSFPAAREAVLEYFSMVYHDAVATFLSQLEYDNESGLGSQSMDAVLLISSALCELEPPWAQILATWSINLLKAIASNNAKCSIAVLQNCEAVRALLNVATVSLSRLDGAERAMCIDMMLGISQCDWVVGHIGRSDPSLVVPRALELALQNSSPQNIDHVVAILTHLSPLHFGHIRQALLQMFEDCLNVDSVNNERRRAIVPYLMQLASKSDIVLKALTKDINVSSSSTMMDKVVKICSSGVTGMTPAAARSALVSLCLRSHTPVFLLLLDWAPKLPFCRELLEHLLQKMESDVRSSDAKIPLLESISSEMNNMKRKLLFGSLLEKYSIARVVVLISFQSPSIFINIVSYFLQNCNDDKTLAILVRIISNTMMMRATLQLSDLYSEVNKPLSLIKQAHENALRDAVNTVALPEMSTDQKQILLDRRETCLERFFHNISTLLRWEKTGKVVQLQNKPITKICEMNLLKTVTVFNDLVSMIAPSYTGIVNPVEDSIKYMDSLYISHALVSMLDLLNIPNTQNANIEVEVLMTLTRANVKYFFRCLHDKDVIRLMKGTQTAFRIFRCVCGNSKVARSLALRELLETAFFKEAEMFGAKIKEPLESYNSERSKDELIMFQNHKQGHLAQLAQSHTSVFHAGIIGKGAKKNNKSDNLNFNDNDTHLATLSKASQEVELLLGAIMSCMEENGVCLEEMTCVSLLLVELVSPDVMYNGLPWPDEDFTKVSIERELYIRQVFDGYPIVWHLLKLISSFRPALCYCSVLLRAVVATLIQQYSAKSDKYIGSNGDSLNEVTIQLLDIMYRGQLLPAPFNYISKMIPHLKPNQIVQILRDCVWNYMRDNVPSPALFTCDSTGLHWRDPSQSKPPQQYTDTLRVLIQDNITTLGHFIMLKRLRTNMDVTSLRVKKELDCEDLSFEADSGTAPSTKLFASL